MILLSVRGGAACVQIREKNLSTRAFVEEALRIKEILAPFRVPLIVNDRVDIALLTDADGIHLGQDDLPLENVKQLVGDRMLVGLSTHSPAQAEAAARTGADYIGVGPLFATATKKNVCDPVGLEYLDYVVKNVRLPFVAIGGIKEHNIAEVRRRGARCMALVTEIVGAPDIQAKVRALRTALAAR
ncbi:MAG: Thiamine-phosphate synthase [Syntrophaceae bacterium PtaU1.Bin231]|nr:MAG: Thiamine-phosphate synthase [Syntrophaceae bacterium PtaU1.Bin231]